MGLLLLATMAGTGWLALGSIPAGLLDEHNEVSTVVVDRHGTVLYETLSGAGTRRMKLAAHTLPPVLVAATIAAEDRRFWSHPGVDLIAVARAALHDVVRRRIAEGGSTITQQVAKLLVTRHDRARRGWFSKVKEGVLALRLEQRFSKREILALYLNLAAYGNQVVGAGRASEAYFGCPASMLTPAQAAFLAALPQQPSRFNPFRDPQPARARQRAVLRQMLASGAMPAAQAREALAERLAFRRPRSPFLAPHFVEMVLADRPPASRGGRVDTTLDAELQAEVQGIVESQREALTAHGASNVAVVVLANATGEWLAWEGSGDYFDAAHGGAINGPLAARQPGSALKPLTYALAFELGYTPATVLPDVPTHFPTAEPGVLYSPRNYDGAYRGPLLARRALAGSENIPAVALASDVGVPNLLRFFERAGLTTFDRTASYYGLGLTLGNAEVRLAELVSAYAAFARDGVWIRPTACRQPNPPVPYAGSGLDDGTTDGAASTRERTLVSPRTTFWITDILSDADAREYVFGRGGSLEFPFPVAVKTGTSQAYHDNWTIGYTHAVSVGVWVGNFDRTPLRASTGVTGAAPIFHAVMLAAERKVGGPSALVADRPLATPSEDLRRVEICALSGMQANAACPTRIHEWLPADADARPCSWHHASDEGLLTIWPPEYRRWAAQHGLLQDVGGRSAARVLAAHATWDPASAGFDTGRQAPAQASRLQISNPPAGATYSIDPTLRAEFQALELRAVAPHEGAIEWRVDGVGIGQADSDQALMWPLTRGTHRITARDAHGRTATADIFVK